MGTMSLKTVFLVLLLCMLVASLMVDEYGAGSDNSCPWMCYGLPARPVLACRALVKLQCVGSQVPEAVLRDCCQQVANIDDWCRCRAISTMMGTMYKELGVQEGRHAAAEVFPGCRRQVMEVTAASVPSVCRLPIVIDASGQRAYVCT